MAAVHYDPFVPGRFAVGVRTLEIQDRDRSRVFPCEIWYPAAGPPSAGAPAGGRAEERDVPAWPGEHPLAIFSHFAGGGHFADDVEGSHEALRAMTLPGEAAWMTAAMLPMSQLCPGEHGHTFTRGPSLAHLDAVLRGNDAAGRFLAGGVQSALAARGVQAVQYQPI